MLSITMLQTSSLLWSLMWHLSHIDQVFLSCAIYKPWASLISHGNKKIKNRGQTMRKQEGNTNNTYY
jgi:hypothetical protein